MNGGGGNDTYVVTTGDLIIENANAGTDTVRTSAANYTLAANLENLILTGIAAVNGTGNDLANNITGNNGNNILNGASGNDTLTGGLGSDTYIVDSPGDVIIENANAGTDTVQSSVDYTLSDNLENLMLTETAQSGTGNSLANTITGNAANNILNGGSGNDTLVGALGDDTYVVDSSGDVITENTGEGTDTVESSVDYTLGANLENLVLTNSALNGTGNDLANSITGNANANSLNGGLENDTLVGGGGIDNLVGAGGNDLLIGGAENDNLTGGAGSDTIRYAIGDGQDRVIGFVTGAGGDFLALNALGNLDIRIFTSSTGTNTQIRVGDGVAGNAGFGTGELLITLVNTTLTQANISTNIIDSSGTAFLFS
jgi:Ca2+-binding RTX toxin-like protein